MINSFFKEMTAFKIPFIVCLATAETSHASRCILHVRRPAKHEVLDVRSRMPRVQNGQCQEDGRFSRQLEGF
jgi:hypothetical protein